MGPIDRRQRCACRTRARQGIRSTGPGACHRSPSRRPDRGGDSLFRRQRDTGIAFRRMGNIALRQLLSASGHHLAEIEGAGGTTTAEKRHRHRLDTEPVAALAAHRLRRGKITRTHTRTGSRTAGVRRQADVIGLFACPPGRRAWRIRDTRIAARHFSDGIDGTAKNRLFRRRDRVTEVFRSGKPIVGRNC